ncbi:Dihydroorotate dehydrogenase B (NAD(+)), electron transfer subunit [bioreactor metagenome]|uniref:Dihydroorotate dehydrogenase B (NAD(+)), electron transfer subunit n=1 Tax=bioreactor metagenome TaxID=1076179 RepID=A0A645CW97_9ZZZZ
MPIQQGCPIVRAERLNSFAYSFLLSAGDLARAAQPGQFVHIRCGDGLLLRRPISVCDVQGDQLRIVFEVRGEGTLWLSQRRAGEELDVLGPLGHGFDVTGDRLLLVGGGIGAPPMLYAAKAAPGRADVFLGFRDAGHAMLLPDFEAVAAAVTVATDDGSLGHSGFITGPVEAALAGGNAYSAVLACGPKPLLAGVARISARYGVPCQVSLEERMGCGVGACLVCACKTADGHYRHVCKHGPVFDAGEVDWNA